MKGPFALSLLLASGLILSAAAQTPSTPAAAASGNSTKIPAISFQSAVFQTSEGQRAIAELQKKFEPREAKLNQLNDEIESLTKDLQAQGDKLSDAERASRSKTIDDKKKELQSSAEDLKKDEENDLKERFMTLAPKVGEVLTAYAKQQGFDLVVDPQQGIVLYMGDSANVSDITKAVVAAYDLKSSEPAAGNAETAPSGSPAAPAGGTPTPGSGNVIAWKDISEHKEIADRSSVNSMTLEVNSEQHSYILKPRVDGALLTLAPYSSGGMAMTGNNGKAPQSNGMTGSLDGLKPDDGFYSTLGVGASIVLPEQWIEICGVQVKGGALTVTAQGLDFKGGEQKR